MARARIAILVWAATALLVAASPNFTGQWALNLDRSDFGDMPDPDPFRYNVEHNGNDIRITTVGDTPDGEMSAEIRCTIGGGACTVKSPVGETRATAKWDGAVLVTEYSTEMNGMRMKRVERMSLSADGRVMTIQSSLTGDAGEAQFTVILDKQ